MYDKEIIEKIDFPANEGCLSDESLYAYVTAKSEDDAVHTGIESHLASCESCRQSAREIEQMISTSEPIPADANPEQVKWNVLKELQPARRRGPGAILFRAAAAVLIAFGLVWLLGDSEPDATIWRLDPQTAYMTAAASAEDEGHFISVNRNHEGIVQDALIRVDAERNVMWSVSFDPPGETVVNDIQPLPDGSCIVIGEWFLNNQSLPQHFVSRFDSSGNRLWNRRIGGVGGEKAHGVVVGQDGDVYIAGRSMAIVRRSPAGVEINGTSHPDLSWYVTNVMRIGVDGELKWYRAIDTSLVNVRRIHLPRPAITLCVNGDVAVCGGAADGEQQKGWMARFSGDGTLLWQKVYGVDGVGDFNVIRATADSGFVLAGTAGFSAAERKAWIVRTDADGEALASHIFEFDRNNQVNTAAVYADGRATIAVTGLAIADPKAGVPRRNRPVMVDLLPDGTIERMLEVTNTNMAIRYIRSLPAETAGTLAATAYVGEELGAVLVPRDGLELTPVMVPTNEALPVESSFTSAVDYSNADLDEMPLETRKLDLKFTPFGQK